MAIVLDYIWQDYGIQYLFGETEIGQAKRIGGQYLWAIALRDDAPQALQDASLCLRFTSLRAAEYFMLACAEEWFGQEARANILPLEEKQ